MGRLSLCKSGVTNSIPVRVRARHQERGPRGSRWLPSDGKAARSLSMAQDPGSGSNGPSRGLCSIEAPAAGLPPHKVKHL